MFKKIIPYSSNATDDERELDRDDLTKISDLIDIDQVRYFGFFERMARILRLTRLVDFASLLDSVFLQTPLFRSLSGYVVLVGRAKEEINPE